MAGTIFMIWGIGLILSIIISLPFCIKRDLDQYNAPFMMFLTSTPIVNIIYPVYILIRYFKVGYKNFKADYKKFL